MTGTLVLAATPIGRVADAPPRLAEELGAADVVAAEDTRRLRRLCQVLGVDRRQKRDFAPPVGAPAPAPAPLACRTPLGAPGRSG